MPNHRLPLLAMLALFALSACAAAPASGSEAGRCAAPHADPLRILALGDSYTIGESVGESDRWPVIFAEGLRAQGYSVEEPLIIARTGWRTDDLDAAISRVDPQGPFDIVTLLIGVNNQFQGRPLAEYEAGYAGLLERAIAFAGGDPARVILLSIPDWGRTLYAQRSGVEAVAISAEIDAFNAAAQGIAAEQGLHFIDITSLTREEVAADPVSMLAWDGLHYSGAMHACWAALALEEFTARCGG